MMPDPLPTRPPVPPCPSHYRHLFGDGPCCVRCGRPRRKWSHYDYDGDPSLKRLLYRWLRGELTDGDVIEAFLRRRPTLDPMDLAAQRAMLAGWKMVCDGADLYPSPPCDKVELWEDDAGGLYVAGKGQAVVFTGLEHVDDSMFTEDAPLVAAGNTDEWSIPTMYPPDSGPSAWPWQAATLVATWHRHSGARLTPEWFDAWGGHPGRAACAYLGIPDAEPVGTGEAARIIGCDSSNVRRLVEGGVVVGRKRGHDLDCDPVSVRWYARLSRAEKVGAIERAKSARDSRR